MKHLIQSAVAWALTAVGLLAFASVAQAQTFPAGLVGSYVVPIAADVAGLDPRGTLSLKVTASGVSTGKLTLANGKSYSFKVTLTAEGNDGVAGRTVIVKGPVALPAPQALEFTSIRLYSDGSLDGEVVTSLLGTPAPDLALVSGQTARLATFIGGVGNSAPWAGGYTIALPVAGPPEGGIPSGAGYLSAGVDAKGVMSYKGKLADGTAITGKVSSSATGTYALTATPYKAGGLFVARIKLELSNEDGPYSVVGADDMRAVWRKAPNSKDKAYRAGFGPLALDVEGSQWFAPPAGQTLAATLGTAGKQFELLLSGAGLDFDSGYLGQLPATLEISSANTLLPVFGDAYAPVTAAEWAKLWKGKVDPRTGVFSGSVAINELVSSEPGQSGNQTTYTPIKFVKRTVAFEGVILRDYSSDTKPFVLNGFFTVPGLLKTDPIRAGFFAAGGELENRGTGGPVLGAIRPGTAGTYSVVVNQTIDFDLSAFAGVGDFAITRNGDPKGIPANGSTTSFTIAPNLSFIIFNGRKIPLVGDSRPTALVFSDATAKTVRNNLTVVLNLNASTGEVIGVDANYFQLMSGTMKIPSMTINGISVKGRTIKAPIPAFVVVLGTTITKTQ
jgi:hypothetical protein